VTLGLLLWSLLATPACGTTVTVAHSGGDYDNIAEAIAAVSEGDTILVAAGSYYGSGNTGLDFQGKNLTLISRDGPGAAHLRSYGGDRIFFLVNGEDERTVIDGFGLSSVGDNDDGGLVYCRDSSPTFVDCALWYSDTIGGRGGAVFALRASPAFVGCLFKHNDGFYGGAVFADSSSVVMADCSFEGNEATGDGGAIHCVNSSLDVSGSTFLQNDSAESGAAIFAVSSSVSVTDCMFDKNIAIVDGGSICLRGAASRSTIGYSTFRWSQGRYGAAIYCEEPARGTIENCTFYECSALIAGNAIYCEDGTALAVENSIISFGYHGTAVGCAPGSSASFDHCVVFGNRAGDELCGAVGDNLYVDPLFCDVYSKDFTLCTNSPCLPENNIWGEQVGHFGAGCGDCDSPVEAVSWGAIKAMYR
jgi:predicted outer membrane repeat protein